MTAPQGHPARTPILFDSRMLELATDEDLQAEFARRLAIKIETRNNKKWDDHDVVCANIDALLALRPGHDRSCTDSSPHNYIASPHKYHHECMRCQLLYLKRNINEGNPRFVGPYSVEIQLVYNKLEK